MEDYSTTYFDLVRGQVRDSAREIVPLVTDLLRPERVVDIGCGTGTWLATFAEHGSRRILGIDGDYVDRSRLDIPADRFVAADLSQPVQVDGRYDLAVCLEVAEHLPPERSAPLVDLLTGLAPVVLFSAAIPLQGGVNHVNEQWPEFWAAHFERQGFLPIDCLRSRIWKNPKVAWFYAQNILLYAEEQFAREHPRLARELQDTNPDQLSLVHPTCFLMRVREERGLTNRSAKEIVSTLIGLSKYAVRRRLHRDKVGGPA
jgi:SAM-dependent methyltransferase